MDDRKQKLNHMMDHLEDFTKEYCDFLPADIPELFSFPTTVEFLRNHVSPNVPFVLRNGVSHWPAIKKWKNNQYLRVQMQDKMCTVAVTPNGYADAIVDDKFVLPEERTMPFTEFLDEMESPRESRVFYLQKQNNCLADEFSSLLNDVDTHIPWATDAIGDLPEAANFWLGDKRAVTSLHKDNYENIYCVIRGCKEFLLYPPVAVLWMPYETFQKSEYYFEDDEFKIKDLNAKVKWIPFDPEFPDFRKYPMLLQIRSYKVILKQGDVLYLPSLWFHHVRQSHSCIAVNYWYEMKYDGKYPFFYLMDKLGQLSISSTIKDTPESEEESESRSENSISGCHE
ncbi:bifunctional peptidase and [Caerostris darwini]|uniref:Bifunctional peptidase and n=1 Tax=Caerostris darwini TaxID=1538125 RepID=A0AAV4NUP4_9ARAC|nr:bifunctional peptidase and [Caerostris darwini]